ncbi:hypothetical protein ANO11243_062530 [Dothideomycetidae sp. 11243]|nr:hypothetical protein ANO11243_062530 [fungal sp. No.11243]
MVESSEGAMCPAPTPPSFGGNISRLSDVHEQHTRSSSTDLCVGIDQDGRGVPEPPVELSRAERWDPYPLARNGVSLQELPDCSSSATGKRIIMPHFSTTSGRPVSLHPCTANYGAQTTRLPQCPSHGHKGSCTMVSLHNLLQARNWKCHLDQASVREIHY